MKKSPLCLAAFAALLAVSATLRAQAPDLPVIKLNDPDRLRGLPLMEALSARASATVWSDQAVSLQDLSDLLWAADGINRNDLNKRTAPSALNAQDVDIYVFTGEGVYRYNAVRHALLPVLTGDFRAKIGQPPPPAAPIQLLLVSDRARFSSGTPEQRSEWGAIDTGTVSQNISLFCAATGLATRPRGSIDKDGLRKLLGLRDSQYPLLNHPVGHPQDS